MMLFTPDKSIICLKITPKEWKAQPDSLTAQTAKAKADYASIIKDLETLAGITEKPIGTH